MKLERPAILVVDMLNDFVTGALACERGKGIVPATAALLDAAREAGVPVIFCNDAHLPGIDREFELWGEHAIAGSEGAQVIPELKVGEIISWSSLVFSTVLRPAPVKNAS